MISSQSSRFFLVVFLLITLSSLSLTNEREDVDLKSNASVTALLPRPITLSSLSLTNEREDADLKSNASVTALLPRPITPGAFDHYILAIQWAPSVCQGPKSNCKMPYPQEFGIHGLWPNLIGIPENQQPSDCDPKNVLDYPQLTPIINDLSTTWPDLMPKPATPPGRNVFWENEWLKHGTCSGLSQFDYFNRTKVLFTGLQLKTSLIRMKHIPGTGAKYSISQIIHSLVTTYKASPRIICKAVKASPPSLKEVRFNVSKSFVLQSMTHDRSAECPPTTSSNDYISFPG